MGRRWVGLTSNGPVMPDWESLTRYLEPTAVPAEPEENALVLHVASRALHEELSNEEATLLQGPVKLWVSMALPPQLASQKPDKRAPWGSHEVGYALGSSILDGPQYRVAGEAEGSGLGEASRENRQEGTKAQCAGCRQRGRRAQCSQEEFEVQSEV